MANLQTLSEGGIKFMTQPNFDSFRAKPYKDPGGLWTIGFGQRITEEEVESYKDGITVEEAQNLFEGYITELTRRLRTCPLALMQHQFDAICSLSYNIGLGAFLGSTIYKNLAVRSIDLSPWLEWTHDARGKVDEGLVRRRRAELKLFIYAIYN